MFAARLFRRHKPQCADRIALPGQRFNALLVKEPRNSKVDDDRFAIVLNHDVGRLEVAVNHAALMQALHQVADVCHQSGLLLHAQIACLAEIQQRLAFDQGGRDVEPAFGDAVVQHARHAWHSQI